MQGAGRFERIQHFCAQQTLVEVSEDCSNARDSFHSSF